MESKRQKQTAEVIRRNFGIVLQQEGPYIYGNAMVTVTNVYVSPDMSMSKIYLSVYNAEDKESIIDQIRAKDKILKKHLAARIKNHVRRIPALSFFNDDTLDEMYKLNSLFDKLHEGNEMGQEE